MLLVGPGGCSSLWSLLGVHVALGVSGCCQVSWMLLTGGSPVFVLVAELLWWKESRQKARWAGELSFNEVLASLTGVLSSSGAPAGRRRCRLPAPALALPCAF